MKKTQSPKSPAARKIPPAKVVTDLSEIEALTSEPVICDVLIKAKPFQFIGRRLIPNESRQVKVLLERAMPPVIKAGAPGELDRYDYSDPDYRDRLEDNKRRARAYALWTAFPHFRDLAAKLKVEPQGLEEITTFIEGRPIDDDVLETLFRQVISDIGEPEKYINFIFGDNSPKS
jgi:hypothetical protein